MVNSNLLAVGRDFVRMTPAGNNHQRMKHSFKIKDETLGKTLKKRFSVWSEKTQKHASEKQWKTYTVLSFFWSVLILVCVCVRVWFIFLHGTVCRGNLYKSWCMGTCWRWLTAKHKSHIREPKFSVKPLNRGWPPETVIYQAKGPRSHPRWNYCYQLGFSQPTCVKDN